MNRKLRGALLIVAVVFIAITLYYPVTQYLEGEALDDEMQKLRRMKADASLDAAASETLPEPTGQDDFSNGTPGDIADQGLETPWAGIGATRQRAESEISDGGSSGHIEKPDQAPTDRMAKSEEAIQGKTDRTPVTDGTATARLEKPDEASTDRMSDLDEGIGTAPGQTAAGDKNTEGASSQPAEAGATTWGTTDRITAADDEVTEKTDGSVLKQSAIRQAVSPGLITVNDDQEAGESALVLEPMPATAAERAPGLDATPIPVREPAPTPAPEAEPTPFVFDEDKILPEYKPLYEENHDMVGWLKIDGTMVDYPVLQRADEEYYLTRDFYGNMNANGQLILDAQCDPFTPDLHLVISGHDMKSGKMFGTLQRYASERFGRQHPIIEFDTLFWRGRYRLVAAFQTWDYLKRGDGFRYNVDIGYRLELIKYLEELDQIKLYDTGVPVVFGDQLITLSTCSTQTDDGRFVVVARRLREGEEP